MSVCDSNAKFENVKMQHVLNSYISQGLCIATALMCCVRRFT